MSGTIQTKIKSLNCSSCPWILAFSSVACVEYERRICFKDKILLRAMFVFQRCSQVSLLSQFSSSSHSQYKSVWSSQVNLRRILNESLKDIMQKSPPGCTAPLQPHSDCTYLHPPVSPRGRLPVGLTSQRFVTTWPMALLPVPCRTVVPHDDSKQTLSASESQLILLLVSNSFHSAQPVKFICCSMVFKVCTKTSRVIKARVYPHVRLYCHNSLKLAAVLPICQHTSILKCECFTSCQSPSEMPTCKPEKLSLCGASAAQHHPRTKAGQ